MVHPVTSPGLSLHHSATPAKLTIFVNISVEIGFKKHPYYYTHFNLTIIEQQLAEMTLICK